ncbi:hypothetical protein EV360DRAFT_17820, partial [Lentinula raphanica]
KIAYKIINSLTLLLSKWREQLLSTDFTDHTLLHDVSTRWNSTHNMLVSFLEMKEHINAFIDHSSYKLSEYTITDEEWEVIGGLVSALSILKEATLFFSADGANISSVIPAMDAIDEALASGILNNEILSQLNRHALAIGKKTLNIYYSLMDDLDLYCITMVFHPEYKLDYFR